MLGPKVTIGRQAETGHHAQSKDSGRRVFSENLDIASLREGNKTCAHILELLAGEFKETPVEHRTADGRYVRAWEISSGDERRIFYEKIGMASFDFKTEDSERITVLGGKLCVSVLGSAGFYIRGARVIIPANTRYTLTSQSDPVIYIRECRKDCFS
jgi:uncharacterized protein YaiE (UPF0345 family)